MIIPAVEDCIGLLGDSLLEKRAAALAIRSLQRDANSEDTEEIDRAEDQDMAADAVELDDEGDVDEDGPAVLSTSIREFVSSVRRLQVRVLTGGGKHEKPSIKAKAAVDLIQQHAAKQAAAALAAQTPQASTTAAGNLVGPSMVQSATASSQSVPAGSVTTPHLDQEMHEADPVVNSFDVLQNMLEKCSVVFKEYSVSKPAASAGPAAAMREEAPGNDPPPKMLRFAKIFGTPPRRLQLTPVFVRGRPLTFYSSNSRRILDYLQDTEAADLQEETEDVGEGAEANRDASRGPGDLRSRREWPWQELFQLPSGAVGADCSPTGQIQLDGLRLLVVFRRPVRPGEFRFSHNQGESHQWNLKRKTAWTVGSAPQTAVAVDPGRSGVTAVNALRFRDRFSIPLSNRFSKSISVGFLNQDMRWFNSWRNKQQQLLSQTLQPT